MDAVETKEPELEAAGSNLMLLRDFASTDGPRPAGFLVFVAFFSLGTSGVGVRYLYSIKSGSLSQTDTS